ncbi:MAG: hypothetical protein LBP89_03705 [Helicobacteraceae bacterium]|jgi:hypothetical protein|nr:hypothetical protein [Helicobacteraceae bacterium]
MKNIFIILIFAVAACADAQTITIKESPDRVNYYTIAPNLSQQTLSDKTQTKKPNRYYLFGDPNLERVSTGKLVVSFESEPNIEEFSERYHLTNPKRISRMFYTWVFENASDIDDLNLAAQIGANETNVRYAKPDWISTVAIQ